MKLRYILVFVVVLLIIVGISIYFINPFSKPPVDGTSAKSCTIPSDCGSFYDCINSKCVAIAPPGLP